MHSGTWDGQGAPARSEGGSPFTRDLKELRGVPPENTSRGACVVDENETRLIRPGVSDKKLHSERTGFPQLNHTNDAGLSLVALLGLVA